MECLAVFFVFFVCFVVFMIFAGRAQAASTRWNQAYGQVSSRYRGVLSPANWFGRPVVRFNYGPTRAVLSATKIAGQPVTQLMLQWPDRHFRFELKSSGEPWAFSARNMETIDLEFPRFQGECRTNSKAILLPLMSDGVKWQIEQLRELEPNASFSILVQRSQLIVRVGTYIRTAAVLDDFVRFGLELFDQAMLTQSDDIEFLNPVEVQVIEDPKCQVCGDRIGGNIVFCVRCRTAHCKECWEYTGVCATYACGETRYSLPKVAQRVTESRLAEAPNEDADNSTHDVLEPGEDGKSD